MGAAQTTLENATRAITGDNTKTKGFFTNEESTSISHNQDKNMKNTPKNETEALAQIILLLASKLYKEYHPKLNDVQLCKQLSLAISDKLDAFKDFELRGLVDQQNKKKVTLRPVLVADTRDTNVKFEVEGTLEKLPDFFYNQYISVPEGLEKEGKKMSVPYIAKFISDILESDKPLRDTHNQHRALPAQDQQQQNQPGFQGRKKHRKRFKKQFRGPQQGGANSVTNISNIGPALDNFRKAFDKVQAEHRHNKIINPSNRVELQNQMNKKNSIRENQGNQGNKNNQREDQKNLENQENQKSKNNQREDQENRVNKGNNQRENQENQKSKNNQREDQENKGENKGENKENQEEDKEVEDRVVEKEEEREEKREDGDDVQKVLENVRNTIKNVGNRNRQIPRNQEQKEEPQVRNNNRNTRNIRKGITKEQLCRHIAHHYMVRANLVAAIATSLPLSSSKHGFCMTRILSLERGVVCLPPDYESLHSLSAKEASKRLAPYIKHFGEKLCSENQGYWKRHGAERMEMIQTGSTRLQQEFTKLLQAMKNRYMSSLKILKEILEELLNNPNLTNEDLKMLSIKTKETLDAMYADCQYDYILGVITLLQIDYQMPRMSQDSQNNLHEAIKNRL